MICVPVMLSPLGLEPFLVTAYVSIKYERSNYIKTSERITTNVQMYKKIRCHFQYCRSLSEKENRSIASLTGRDAAIIELLIPEKTFIFHVMPITNMQTSLLIGFMTFQAYLISSISSLKTILR